MTSWVAVKKVCENVKILEVTLLMSIFAAETDKMNNRAKLFNKDVTINAVLYIVEKMGGKVDMHKIFKTLYFADMMHLSKYGRSITGDVYIAMNFGPVPSKTDDIFKAVRGDSYFSDKADDLKSYFHFYNRYTIQADAKCDMDWLSESDIECLDASIEKCKDKTFEELTALSHGIAWQHTSKDREISIKDILRESGDTEDYAEYIARGLELENMFH